MRFKIIGMGLMAVAAAIMTTELCAQARSASKGASSGAAGSVAETKAKKQNYGSEPTGVPSGVRNCILRLKQLASREPMPPYDQEAEQIINGGLLWNNPDSKCSVGNNRNLRRKVFEVATAWREMNTDEVRKRLAELDKLAAFSFSIETGRVMSHKPPRRSRAKASGVMRPPLKALPVRSYLYRDPIKGLGAYGYVLFGHEPGDDERERYGHVCDSFHRSLISMEEYGDIDLASLMVTYWLLKQDSLTPDNCTEAIEHYDFATANRILSGIGKHSARGPVLCAFRQPFSSDSSIDEGLVFDLSDFDDVDIDRALSIWKDRISRNPDCWNNGFSIVKAREEARSLLNKYGDEILAVIHNK